MKFVQIMEFTGSTEEAIDSINNYITIAGAETKVKKPLFAKIEITRATCCK